MLALRSYPQTTLQAVKTLHDKRKPLTLTTVDELHSFKGLHALRSNRETVT